MNLETIPVVDTHQHLWDLDKLNLPWVQGEGLEPLNRSFLFSDYQEATEGIPIRKTVYMEVDVHPSQQAQEARQVIELCQKDDNPMAAAVISGRPESPDFADYIKPFADSPFVKGIRRVLHVDSVPRGLCQQNQFVENIQLLGKLDLSFDLCMRPGEIVDAVPLVDHCPQTRFVVDHCGNWNVRSTDEQLYKTWKEGMQEMAQRENVVCKISGIVVTAEKESWTADDLAPTVNFCLDTFGEDRVLFGGDWPVCTLKATYRQWFEALKEIVRDRPTAFQRKLFYDTAVAFYHLS